VFNGQVSGNIRHRTSLWQRQWIKSMSRGFVKEDDQEEAPFIPPRAALPDGVPNHVTPRGLQLLQDERTALLEERAGLQGSDDERRRRHAEFDGRLALLNERIVTAHVVERAEGSPEEVRFGSTVTYRHADGPQRGTERTFTIVGVDEASVKELRIAFTAPIARVLIGTRVGDRVPFQLGATIQHLEILNIR
jgi:transcription elongation factor GreB